MRRFWIILLLLAFGVRADVAPQDHSEVQGALAKVKSPSKTSETDLSEYAGNYAAGVWGGEAAVRVWGDQLAMIRLPSAEIGDVTKLKHVEGDRFVLLNK